MGVRKDLKRARKRSDLDRARVELVRDDQGVVREARTAPLAGPPADGATPADIPFVNAAEAPDAVVIRRRGPGGTGTGTGAGLASSSSASSSPSDAGEWRPVTAAEFAREVTATAKGLIAAGLRPGGRVALMSRTRYEWQVLDFAIWAAGGQTVPIYATSSPEQIEWIVRDSGARLLIVENAANEAAAEAALAAVPAADRPRSWQLDAGALAQLATLGREIEDEEVTERRSALTPDTVATVCYTSGTTGRPKGCVLTHGNLYAEAANTVELLHPIFKAITGQAASTLLFLPLAHILGRTIQVACLLARIELGHCPSIKPDELRPELRSFRPTFVVGVPYLFEKIHDTGRATAERIGRGSSFDRADRIAVAFGERSLAKFLDGARGPGLGLTLATGLYDLLVYRRVRKELGGRLRYAISGGSPLDRGLNLFFYTAGVIIYEGYGLTETSAAATITPPLRPRPGTVGLPVPGTTVRIADDGEVLVKGPIVFGAYWQNAEATADVITPDGWFATGDLGALDDDGYLTITGRKKDIIVTSGGKNVSPAVLEDRLRSRSPVGQCIVVGDNRSYIAALITLEPESVAHWLDVHKLPATTPMSEVIGDPRMVAAVRKAVDFANEAVSRAESIRRFALVEGEFTEENGLLTPSLKIKRQAVTAAYEDEIEKLYEPAPDAGTTPKR